jgi:regulator of protease activity HflC (stomatin/prohibitin superfamily)
MEALDLLALSFWGLVAFVIIVQFFRSIRLVPTKSAYIVERLGRYHKTLEAGFHTLIPFIDKVTFIQDLKEETIDVPPQDCFSKDEVNVEVDGVIYLSVIDPVKASYGITNYRFAAVQLAQTTTRSVIGTLDLDRTFEERNLISAKVVEVLDRAGESWGVKVHRYEIRNIAPPQTVRSAMEKQVNAERERRAILAKSEGNRQSRINRSEGMKTELINKSEGERQRRINEAEGRAQEILAIAQATAESIEKIAYVIQEKSGEDALKLQLAEKYLEKTRHLAAEKTTVILPANLADFNQWMSNIRLFDSR